MEIWDAYDADRRKTGGTLIRGEKIPEGCYHLVVEACVMNAAGELLIQRRADDKPLFPVIDQIPGKSGLSSARRWISSSPAAFITHASTTK